MDEVSLTSYTTWADLIGTWKTLDLPDKAWRAEIIDETVVVAPPDDSTHGVIINLLHRYLVRATPGDWGVFQALAVQIPQERCLFVPDIAVVPRAWLREADYPAPARCLLLAVEVTSKRTADVDRTTKPARYALAGVPHFILVDLFAEEGPMSYLHSAPSGRSYLVRRSVPLT
ncbi:Uma2 family endonuclease [Saccharopolyspora mangrovi]|uniref:Uma2 family endonuclease n=1 Tax=Saccharopolyspora mangrovi TaxID=3082379 RepID=A0ABU6ACS1_9PSEU|nr:Uma2 family endonuclease [Saccharopolyspora sp. S2-29]MEB3369325.1 Uma2 family endonuclease [Saccharopolyspora sp. S2-29]